MFKLDSLKAPLGSKQAKKRKGKGMGSGLGKTAGRGHKGQRARAGSNVHQGFEGGQMPLQRRLPKVGFNSGVEAHKVRISVTELGQFAGQELGLLDLMPKSFRKDPRAQLTLSGGRAPAAWPKSVEAHKVSPSTKSLLESNSVTVKIIEYKSGKLGHRKESSKAKA
ncbi:50S ribosomal protein L15 [bacterium]|nr:50S ribosomal protein L15 [bacterium]